MDVSFLFSFTFIMACGAMSIANYHEFQEPNRTIEASLPRRYPMPRCSKPNQPSKAAVMLKILPSVDRHAGGKATRGASGETDRAEPHACI